MVFSTATSKDNVQKILDQNQGVAILEFCDEKCQEECNKLQPYLETLNTDKKIPLIRLDVNKAKDLCSSYKCQKTPCFGIVSKSWNNMTECRECHETKEVLDIFNHAVECREKMPKKK